MIFILYLLTPANLTTVATTTATATAATTAGVEIEWW